MSRLPVPGQDSGTWGDILNDYLLQAHNADGTIKDNAVTAAALAPNSVTKADVGLGNVDNTSDATKNSATATLTNKTLDNTNTVTLLDTKVTIQNATDTTKRAKFQLSGISAGNTRTYTLPDASGTLALQTTAAVFDARDYGVIADGATHNNVANLLDCFAQAIAAGAQEVLLPAGTINTSDGVIGTVTANSGRTYTNNGGIPLPTNNQALTVTGHGKGVTTLKLTAGFPRAFDFWLTTSNQSYKNITLRDFTVDRNNLIGTQIAAPATVTSSVTLTPNTWVTLPGVTTSGYVNAQYVFCPGTNAGTAKKRMVPARVSGGNVQVFNTESSVTLNSGDTVQGALYGHTILGTFCGVYIAGSNMFIDGVTVENVDAINLADTPGINNSEESPDRCTGISITVLYNSGFSVSGVPSITNFRAKNVRILGGSRGIDVTGNRGTFIDEVWYEDCFHDTLIAPTVNWDSLNFMIGQDAWVNRCGFVRCHGRNAGDVAWEIDQPWDAHIVDCIWEEGFNGGYTTTFTPPARTSAGPPTTTLTGSLTAGAISGTVAAIPAAVSYDGLCLVDSELMWYSASSSTAVTLNRGMNGTTAASHSSGATVTFIEVFKTRVHDVRSKIYSSTAMTVNGGGRAYLSYPNNNLPLPPLTIRDATAEFSGGTLTDGQFIYWQGWRPDLDMQGVKVNHVGLTQTSGTAYGFLVSWLDVASSSSMQFTNAIRPRIFGRNNSFRAHGTINSTSQYSAFRAGQGFAFLDFEMTIEAVMNGSSPGAGVRLCNLWPLSPPFVLDSGSRVSLRARMPGFTGSDAAPIALVVGPGPGNTNIINGLHVDLDMYDFSFATNSTDTNYSPWYIGTGNVGKVQFGKVRHSRNAVGSYPVAKHVAVPVSANYTVAPDDEMLLVDSSGGPITITLPPSTGGAGSVGEPLTRGRDLQIIDVGFAAATNNITITPAATDKIDKGAAGASVKLTTNGSNRHLVPYASLPGWVTSGSIAPAVFDAADQGYISWAYDPAMSYNGIGPTAGLLYVTAVPVRRSCTITNVLTGVAVAGSGLTSGQNFAALYNSSGTLLSQTADQTTAWSSVGIKTMALGAAQTVAPGIYYVGFVANGTTPPKLFMPIGGPYESGLLNGTPVRFGYDATHTGLTTAAPATMASPTASASFWAAIS